MISRGDAAVMDLDRTAGDGKAETGASGRPLASVGHSREGLEKGLEVFFGHAGTMIADGDLGARLSKIDRHLDRRFFSRMANGVTEHVVERAPDQRWVAPHRARRFCFELNRPLGGRGFKGGIVNDLIEEGGEIEIHRLGVWRSSLETFQQEKLPDEIVEPPGLTFDAIEGFGRPGALAIASELEGHREARQRRTQFVGDVPKKPPLGTNQILESTRHGVEIMGELSDLVPAAIDGFPDPR